jgi:hypothetical protein
MPGVERVTVTLPDDLVKGIDRREKSRSKFSLRPSAALQNPHPESADLTEQGLEEWARKLPEENAEALVDSTLSTPVRWVRGRGWVRDRE